MKRVEVYTTNIEEQDFIRKALCGLPVFVSKRSPRRCVVVVDLDVAACKKHNNKYKALISAISKIQKMGFEYRLI